MKPLAPVAVALCIGAGLVLSEFVSEPRPVGYLTRPLIALCVLSVIIGLGSSLVGRASSVVAVFLVAWLVEPGSVFALVIAIGVAALIGLRLWRGRMPNVSTPVVVGAVVFLVAGLIPVVPLMSWSSPASASEAGEPTFLILLDGYPRVDTLAHLGVDVGGYVEALEDRGFDYYPEATSHHAWTYRTLTMMTTGEPMAADHWGSSEDRRRARSSWQLPKGFTAVAPPVGSVTFPDVPVLNPGGPTLFEAEMLRKSAFWGVAGEYVMDGFRSQLNRALRVLSTTEETRVFAHILAPHTPFLYDGEEETAVPACWPTCTTLEIEARVLDMSVKDWSRGIAGYLEWLNPRLLEVIDGIIDDHPNANVVLFSDHGGRFDGKHSSEWHKTFLAARTPGRPGLFTDSPHPESLLTKLESR